jgi:tetratricopeptide (TPR) repeat protein
MRQDLLAKRFLVRQMPEENSEKTDKAKPFFERARQVAAGDNYDYAIDMYLEGILRNPDAVEDGHQPLRELALARQAKGGKKPSMMQRLKLMRGKSPLNQMVGAEYLLAKDPEHLPYGEAMLKAAVAGGYKATAKWIADLLFGSNNATGNPSLATYILLKDSYEAIGRWDRALAACQYAVRMRPNDEELANEYQRLSAEMTVSRGKYDQEGDFRKAVKDRETQERQQSQESVIKTEDWRTSAADAARKMYADDPNLPRNIFNLAEALADLRNDESENEAIRVLEEAYVKRQDFSFKQRAGLVRINQIKRKIRDAESALEANPGDAQAKAQASGLMSKLNETELEHWQSSVKNYPTDLRAKYEYGVRLVRNKRYDEAIPLLQEAQKDPRHKIAAMDKIGMCFFLKGWYSDAVDVFTHALDAHEIKDDDISKELRYNLGRAYEELGERSRALEIYRKIAQLDFGYKDVPQRVDKLRQGGI